MLGHVMYMRCVGACDVLWMKGEVVMMSGGCGDEDGWRVW